ncbi:putative kaempferol 3-O-galactosyltransferase [Helianthus annuus]|uniref:Kaempferol 3-O-galactosyltransferase n=1 Tax=Helianthus annuus TaxID=4232 RepID=A0A251U879_HELAN|nr:putative kaempferol 3-O-galactosyltransferase [Helianthus annuus]KAJ0547912.1 putative kaempferol 3-O-galactosyltransferase [Helianthus annuus]
MHDMNNHIFVVPTFAFIGSIGPNEEIVDLLPGLKAVRLGDLPSGVVLGNLESPFSTMLHKMGRTLHKATAVTLNSFQELDPNLTTTLSSKLNNFLRVGPFNLMSKEKTSLKVDEFSCISWLDRKTQERLHTYVLGQFSHTRLKS